MGGRLRRGVCGTEPPQCMSLRLSPVLLPSLPVLVDVEPVDVGVSRSWLALHGVSGPKRPDQPRASRSGVADLGRDVAKAVTREAGRAVC